MFKIFFTKKNVCYKYILGNLTIYIRKIHLPRFSMNEGDHRKNNNTYYEAHFLYNICI